MPCRLDDALQSYNAAVLADPTAAAALHVRGELLEKSGQLEDALADFDRCSMPWQGQEQRSCWAGLQGMAVLPQA